MAYNPLEVGGADDYPVEVGSMLLTIVDPNPGYERAYNRWYERDHYYGGCMIGPWLFAGSRWVATRELKDLRWPSDSTSVCNPTDGGSYVAIYWVEKGHHEDHFDNWSTSQVFSLYEGGRGFSERTHRHTILFSHIGDTYRDDDPVPVELALDHCYDGIVLAWFDAASGDAYALHDELSKQLVPELLAGSGIEIASSWTPHPNEAESKKSPMDLGTPGGGPDRLCQIFFLHGDVRGEMERLHRYTDAVEAAGLATTQLVAPWFRTVPGTDKYVDELW
ncbi:MAG: hypothetical protein KDB21_00935 [Acidimicrobiales bacterium]|nr:hypothetical protein [Acidimicrobiales bacterium]